MTKTYRLTDLQLVLLSAAAARQSGSMMPLPDACRDDSERAHRAIASLLRRNLAEEASVTDATLTWRKQDQDHIGLFITEEGRGAIGAGLEPEGEYQIADALKRDNTADNTKTVEAQTEAALTVASPRPGSKIASVIALPERDDGATLDEMVEAIFASH